MAQLLTSVSPQEAIVIDLIDWLVVSLFIAEYASGLYAAASRRRHVKDPWNALNLGIILLAFGGLVASSPILYSSPLLRLFRTAKFLTESGRTSKELLPETGPGYQASRASLLWPMVVNPTTSVNIIAPSLLSPSVNTFFSDGPSR